LKEFTIQENTPPCPKGAQNDQKSKGKLERDKRVLGVMEFLGNWNFLFFFLGNLLSQIFNTYTKK